MPIGIARAARATPISLQPCDANDVYQLWAVGNSNALAQQARVANANVSVDDMCSGRVIIEGYDPNDAGARRIVERYGSVDAMAATLAKAKTDNCSVMFQSGSQVPFYSDLRVIFVPQSTSAAMATQSLSRLVSVYTPFWATIDESEQPFALRVDAAFHHELTHALDFLAYLPAGFVEGYANWVPYHLGLVRASEKRSGGRWTDGYSTTAFFMLWLDDQPIPHAVGQRFTDHMREQAALSAQNANWFFPWFTQSFGRDCNAMWQEYQSSF